MIRGIRRHGCCIGIFPAVDGIAMHYWRRNPGCFLFLAANRIGMVFAFRRYQDLDIFTCNSKLINLE